MNKPLCRNNQNTERSKTVKSVSIAQAEEKKNMLRNQPLKMYIVLKSDANI